MHRAHVQTLSSLVIKLNLSASNRFRQESTASAQVKLLQKLLVKQLISVKTDIIWDSNKYMQVRVASQTFVHFSVYIFKFFCKSDANKNYTSARPTC